MTPLQSGVAACLLDAMTDKEAAQALGTTPGSVNSTIERLCAMFNARNRVQLALTLQQLTTEARMYAPKVRHIVADLLVKAGRSGMTIAEICQAQGYGRAHVLKQLEYIRRDKLLPMVSSRPRGVAGGVARYYAGPEFAPAEAPSTEPSLMRNRIMSFLAEVGTAGATINDVCSRLGISQQAFSNQLYRIKQRKLAPIVTVTQRWGGQICESRYYASPELAPEKAPPMPKRPTTARAPKPHQALTLAKSAKPRTGPRVDPNAPADMSRAVFIECGHTIGSRFAVTLEPGYRSALSPSECRPWAMAAAA